MSVPKRKVVRIKSKSIQKQSKLRKVTSFFNPRSLRGGMALFALVFALGGAGYYTYKSFAASGAGSDHTCYTRNDGYLYCWGDNSSGQLGIGSSSQYKTTPQRVNLTHVRQVSLGSSHTCAVKSDDTLWCWGDNTSGQLGLGASSPLVNSPKKVADNVISVAAGHIHTCDISTKHNLRCWGNNSSGQLGIGSQDIKYTPTLVPGLASSNVLNVSSGAGHTCAVRTDNRLLCWGRNNDGELGYGNQNMGYTVPVLSKIQNVKSVTAGTQNTCAITISRSLYCWGNNHDGQLGTGSSTGPSPLPVEVRIFRDVTSSVALGNMNVCAISVAKNMYCWGQNNYGGLGTGNTTYQYSPKYVRPDITSVAAGDYGGHTCVAQDNGLVYCTGKNSSGQLGIGSTANKVSFTQVPNYSWK